MRVYPHTQHLCSVPGFVCALLVCIASTTAWSDSDKTIVDLERGLPEAPSRYHRPRAAHLYQYDKTEVDLAVPSHSNLPRNSVVRNALLRSQRQCRPPTTPPPQAPLPGEDAKGQLMRQVQFLTSGSTLIALKVPLQNPYDFTIAVLSR